jgi:integrase
VARLPEGLQARDRGSTRQYRAVVTDRTRRISSGSFMRIASKWFDRQGEAVAWRDATLADLERNGHVEVSATISVEMACRRWLLEATTVGTGGRKKIQGSTARRYAKTIDNLIAPTIGSDLCTSMRSSTIRMWATTQAMQDGSDEVHRGLALLRQAFDMMVQLDEMGSNPALNVKMARKATTEGIDEDEAIVSVFLEPDQVRAILDAADQLADGGRGKGSGQRRKAWIRYRPMAYLLFGSGLRIGEVLALRWMDIDLEAGVVQVRGSINDEGRLTGPKTATSVRSLRLGAQVLEQLLELRSQRGVEVGAECFVFGGRTPLDRSNAANRMWAPLMEAAGVEGFSFHDCRHYHASALIAAGMPDVDVSSRLGHSNVGITRKIYVHCFKAHEARRETQAVELESTILGR